MIIRQVFCPFQRLWRGQRGIEFYAFQPYARHQVEVIDGNHIKLYGNTPSEITVRHKSGVIENYRVSFKESTETVLAI